MDILPHLLPYALYVALGTLAGVVPESVAPWMDPLRAVVVLGALLVFARRRAYPELTVRATPARGALWLAIAAGLVVAAIWIPLARLVPALGGARGGFDAAAAGASLAPVLVGARLLAFVVVIPFAEELFVRSLVPRYVDAGDGDWREVAVGHFSPLAFAVSVGLFTLTHPEWLSALVTAVIWTLLLRHTRRLRDVVVAHAATNGALAVYILVSGDTQWW